MTSDPTNSQRLTNLGNPGAEPPSHYEPERDVNALWVGIIVEGGLLVAGLLLGWLGWHAANHSVLPLEQLTMEPNQGQFEVWWSFVFPSLAATIPLLIYLWCYHWFAEGLFAPMARFVDRRLKPMFQASTTFELLVLATMAGVGEELFFRWALQGGLAAVLSQPMGPVFSQVLAIAVVSALFGLCHWVNSVYGITTMLAGAYLGIVMVVSGHWLVAAFAHAAFDFAALLYIVRRRGSDAG